MRFIQVLKSRKGKPIPFPELERKITSLCKKFQLDLFYVFGSYAFGKADSLSDLDLAYHSKKKVDQLKLLSALQDIFEEEAIDLIDLTSAPPLLTHHVIKSRCLYAKDLRTKIDFETRAESIYFDTVPLRKIYFTEMLKRISHGTYGN